MGGLAHASHLLTLPLGETAPLVERRRRHAKPGSDRSVLADDPAVDQGRDFKWIYPARPMSRAEEFRILIHASPAEVWKVLADIRAWPEWAPTVTSVTTTATELVVGATAELEQPKIPTATWTVTAVQPERGFTWTSRSSGGVDVTADHELHPKGSDTEVVLRITFAGLMAPVASLFGGRMTRSYLKQEAEGLKARVEQNAR